MGKEDDSRGRLIKRLFDILLLWVNSIGIAGALTQVLEIPRGGFGDRFLFWGGVFLFCVLSVLVWQGTDRVRLFKCVCLCALPYVCLAVLYRKILAGGLFLALQDAVATLEERYQFRIVWPDGLSILREAGWEGGAGIWIITVSVLFCLFPLELLAGFFLTRGGAFWLLPGNVLWFAAACACDSFPGDAYLVCCVTGVVALLAYRGFGDNFGAGAWAAVLMAALGGLGMGVIYRFVMPVADERYEAEYEDRMRFYALVNQEWLPELDRLFSGQGLGAGPDVSGAFNRQSLLAYTEDEKYRVTVDALPSDALYLKGYVGVTYGRKEWLPQSDQEMEGYYVEHGLKLPEDYGQLANLSYISMGGVQDDAPAGSIRIEELGGRGSYSVYPYGAYVTEDYEVHGDGSVERKGGQYGFPYRPLSADILNAGVLPQPWRRAEERYRQYVYDSFLEYPVALEQLWERLDGENIRRDDVSLCVSDITGFLERQAVYNLDAGENPRGKDFVEYFLFESHEGYCVHFASAAVLALRYCGIPARFVTGYVLVPSDFSGNGDGAYTAVATGRQAHAWAEIYLDGKGWLPVEATPGAAAFYGGNDTGLMADWEGRRLAAGDSPSSPGIRESGEADGGMEAGDFPSVSEPDQEEKGESPEDSEEESPESVSGESGKEGNTVPEEAETEGSFAEKDFEAEKDSKEESGTQEGSGAQEDSKEESGTEEGSKAVEDFGSAGYSPSGEGSAAEGESIPQDDGGELTKGRIAAKLALAVLAAVVPAALAVIVAGSLYNGRKRRWHELVQGAEAGRRVLLLYRNMGKALRVIGCPRRLGAEDGAFRQALGNVLPQMKGEDYDSFYTILEKASFGNEEPSQEELCEVRGLHDSLVKEVYERAPFYRKLLFGMIGCYR